MSDLDLDQHLTNVWPRYDYDVSQFFSKKYTIKWTWYDQPMTKIWLGILGLTYECSPVWKNGVDGSICCSTSGPCIYKAAVTQYRCQTNASEGLQLVMRTQWTLRLTLVMGPRKTHFLRVCLSPWEFGVPLMENFIPASMVWDVIATKHD